jgi:hypothetical protein
MKERYAKLWLKKYIRYNHDKFDEKTFNRKLNWAIVNLSHRVCKSHGLAGHNRRQNVRKVLWNYSKSELKPYRPSMISKIISYIKRIRTRLSV